MHRSFRFCTNGQRGSHRGACSDIACAQEALPGSARDQTASTGAANWKGGVKLIGGRRRSVSRACA